MMTALDGYQVYDFFRAGSRRVSASRKHLDDINVFPVPDGDTGTNLSSTLAGTVEATVPGSSASSTLGLLADAALVSARGNSGVIFAQFVSGLSEAVATAEIKTHDFAAAVLHAYGRAKAAISDPRDGTMLSIIEDWASSLARRVHDSASFADLIGATRKDLHTSLNSTTEKLAELRAAGVVDAGAAGFVEFVEGGHDFLLRGTEAFGDDHVKVGAEEDSSLLTIDDHAHGPVMTEAPRYRYCTEAMLSGTSLDAQTIRSILGQFGDSLIVAAGHNKAKIHIHTDRPETIMQTLASFGTVGGQKVDDMHLQFTDAHDRRSPVAIVTDSACDLPAELLEQHRIHAVPLLLSAGGSEYLDKLTMSAESLGKVAEGKGLFPKTAQPPAHFFGRLYSYLGSHYDSVVAIHLAACLSGTYETSLREATKARQTGTEVHVLDSKHLSGSLGLVVLRAAQAAEAGASASEIAATLPQWSAKARILVSVTSLRYMVKGGRVSPLKGLAAKVLNLKPIVSVDETGKSILYGKSFSEESNLKTIIRMVAEQHREQPLRCYAIGHSNAPEKAAAFAARLEKELGFPPLYITQISSVVALNAGPGAVSVVTMSE
ncbi:MAG: DegV family protein [Spirochaetia bacterium]|jgi:DegV family protein with EDD domain|nr:DegV family protein [Spirochaetia bacterium]